MVKRYSKKIFLITGGAGFIGSHIAEHLVAEVNGKRFEVKLHTPEPVVKRHRAKAAMVGGASGTGLTSPMQGTVVKIAVADGQSVEVGDLVIVLEAMKMEHTLVAPFDGTVAELSAVAGAQVQVEALLVRIEASGEAGA